MALGSVPSRTYHYARSDLGCMVVFAGEAGLLYRTSRLNAEVAKDAK